MNGRWYGPKRVCKALIFALLLVSVLAGCASGRQEGTKLPVKVLILPKFEVGELEGDSYGEAQHLYEGYLSGAEEYEIKGSTDDLRFFYKDGVALAVLGMGKVSAALNTGVILQDERFDFSETYVISTGCAGSAAGYGTMGDVFVITAACDYDLGHHADPRDLADDSRPTWFHSDSFTHLAAVRLDRDLTDKVYNMVKDVPLSTTEKTEKYMKESFPGEDWAGRKPKVLKGTAVSGDNYWKGWYGHENAMLIRETYGCPDPYAVTEMEEIAVARTMEAFGMLDRLIITRASVNVDVFTQGLTPELLWGKTVQEGTSEGDVQESVDIFETAMENNFHVCKVIIDAILNGGIF